MDATGRIFVICLTVAVMIMPVCLALTLLNEVITPFLKFLHKRELDRFQAKIDLELAYRGLTSEQVMAEVRKLKSYKIVFGDQITTVIWRGDEYEVVQVAQPFAEAAPGVLLTEVGDERTFAS